jgi:hypothetical protein
MADSTHIADLGPNSTPDTLSDMGTVTQQYLDSLLSSTLRNPDDVRYGVSFSFSGDLASFATLNIPGSDPADFCLQPEGVLVDMHIDLKHSIAWIRRGPNELSQGKKVWIIFPRSPHNEGVWLEFHNSTHDYECLLRSALEKMQGGQYAIQNSGDLVYIPVGLFHGVITLEASILVGSWIVGNGFQMLGTLCLYMRTSQVRHKGKNEENLYGWTDKEKSYFKTGMETLLSDLQPPLSTPESHSTERLMEIYNQIWQFAEFLNQRDPSEHEKSVKWFKGIVWSKEWRHLTQELCNVYEESHWLNSCFLSGCDDRRNGGRHRSSDLKAVITHMYKKHLVKNAEVL